MIKNIIIFLLSLTVLILFSLNIFSTRKEDAFYKNFLVKPIWERKISLDSSEPLRIGLITDTHIDSVGHFKGDMQSRYLPEKYQVVFDDFNESMGSFDPDFLIHLGDAIEGTKESVEMGKKNLSLVRQEMEKAGKPIFWVVGNHDLRAVPRRHFQEALGIEYSNKSFDHGPYRFIILDSAYRKNGGAPINPLAGDYVPGFVPEESLLWLERELKTDKNVIVLMHHSLVSSSETAKNPISNRTDVVSLLEKYNALAVFQGHIEKRYYSEVNGVRYYSFPGTKKNEIHPRAHYQLVLNKGEIEVEILYRNPENLEKIREPFYKEGAMFSVDKKEEKTENLAEEIEDCGENCEE